MPSDDLEGEIDREPPDREELQDRIEEALNSLSTTDKERRNPVRRWCYVVFAPIFRVQLRGPDVANRGNRDGSPFPPGRA